MHNTTNTRNADRNMPPQLPTRKLGKNGPQVPALGFGLMGLSLWYGAPEPDEARLKLLDRAYELGETFWDSADVYGDSEDLVGKWFAKNPDKRNEIFLATKYANKVVSAEPGKPLQRVIDSSPEYTKEACAKSLKRLGVECIDLYYCHRVDKKTPIEKTVEAMVELKKEGKIKYIGLSEISSETLRRASKVHHIDAVQIEYSPFAIDIETPQIALMETCRSLGVAIVAYSPLGRGMLTGAYTSPSDFEDGDFRKMAPRFSAENFPKNLKLVSSLQEIAKKKGCTAGQLSLAWLLAQGEDVIPIPGTKKIKYLEENLGALEVKLSEEEEKEIRSLVEDAEVHGLRYPEAFTGYLFADTPELKV
ncbi:Aldo/keto reductase [Stipitochalara longipes BDJ]|nr:Aldo/keto reductase [Stipitochalara longipes BDJ]